MSPCTFWSGLILSTSSIALIAPWNVDVLRLRFTPSRLSPARLSSHPRAQLEVAAGALATLDQAISRITRPAVLRVGRRAARPTCQVLASEEFSFWSKVADARPGFNEATLRRPFGLAPFIIRHV